MNSQTHFLIASALLGRRATRQEHTAIAVGALLPDAYMLVFVIYGISQGWSAEHMWSVAYWQAPWQAVGALSNSVPLFAGLFALSVAARWHAATGSGILGRPLQLVALAALAHLGVDFLTHANDAHQHFWPLSDWRFASPLSYWEAAHHGQLVSLAETGLGMGLIIVLWRRHHARWARALLSLAALGYVGVLLFFGLGAG